MGRVERTRELHRRRHRRAKLKKLRATFKSTADKSKQQEVIQKVKRLSPFVDLEAEAAAE